MYIGKIDSEERQFVSKTLVEYADKTRKTNKISDDSKVKLIYNMLILSNAFENVADKALTIKYKADEEDLFNELFTTIIKNHDDSIATFFMVSKDISVEALNKIKNYSDFLKIIKKSDYLVLLSDNETWGLVLTEAKILGVPCIVTDFDVAYEQIIDDKTGIILSRTKTESYSNKIEDILANKQKFKDNLKKFRFSNIQTLNRWKKIL